MRRSGGRGGRSMEIAGKVVLITGASQGIGAACAAAFRQRGARLSLTARSEEKLRQVGGADALITAGDLTLAETRQRVVERTLERYGTVDILVNNAGVGLYGPAWRTPPELARALFELNFFAALSMIQLVAPHMRERRSGVIVNVSSVAGKVSVPWLTLYSASKAALVLLSDGLRRELLGDGIRVLTVCPGYVATDFADHALGGDPPRRIPGRDRFAITAEQCAEAIVRGVEREKRTIVPPAVARLFVAADRLFPGFLDRRLAAFHQALEREE
ncbi:MAG: SDR family NAD(P)-dependent oxidoreductase [Bryobacterales bacterium]|nr:SDR family NAD(P)-dependent oxidoreductase [Bryobacteraceae bacterium]MDW8353312.1 SDR family NAD(P)-dependent oxidoreductase [Bryobacterales bacterium]